MRKQKKSGNKDDRTTKTIILITAILQLISSVVSLIHNLIE